MPQIPLSIQNLINEFAKLPGVGQKTAERYVFYLLKKPKEELERFANSLLVLKETTKQCSICFNVAESDPCAICSDPRRDKSILCVVADTRDLLAIDHTHEYGGAYHVLGGVINPLNNIKPESLKIQELAERVKKNSIKEIILAFNPDMEGETTAMYIKKLLEPYKIKITRLARGLPMGADLEYADEITLTNAIKERKEI